MPEDILNPEYWHKRLVASQRMPSAHHAIFLCSKEFWDEIAEGHRRLLAGLIKPGDKILDAGCGWGRLLELMPIEWRSYTSGGAYVGVDISPEFIQMAQDNGHIMFGIPQFFVGDLRKLPFDSDKIFDWAILISIRRMMLKESTQEEWAKMETELRRVSKRILLLEYDADDPGQIIEC